MYDNAKSCVRKNCDLSAVFDCQIGVRQGYNLSPLLFAIFINDFHYHMSQHYSGIPFVPIDMANCINNDELFVLLRLWVLLYADDTSKIRNKPLLKIGIESIDVVDEYIYLGTTFCCNGSFKKAITKQISQAKGAMFSLIAKAQRLNLPIYIVV